MSIFIFRRDLRLADNLGLLELQKKTKDIIPIFVFTPEQITSKNKFKSNNAIQFMIESLLDLKQEFKKRGSDLLVLFYQCVNQKDCQNIQLMKIYLLEVEEQKD